MEAHFKILDRGQFLLSLTTHSPDTADLTLAPVVEGVCMEESSGKSFATSFAVSVCVFPLGV